MAILGEFKLMAFAATTNPQQAKEFYEGKLGLRFLADEQFALVFDANGTMLRVQKVKDVAVAPYTTLGWEVPDITAATIALRDAGVLLEKFPGLPQDELGIWAAPGGAKVGWFKDPEGNILSITQFVTHG
jgi:catechol 2,3-dioxygenase-like lactoylglutathione lyase family enzyme